MTNKYYRWIFEDGYIVYCRGFDEIEMQHEVLKHGKLIKKEAC